MNGQEQKERQTAVALLRRDLNELEKNTLDLCKVETEERMKADDGLREDFTVHYATEKAFRDAALKTSNAAQARYAEELHKIAVAFMAGFITLPWWKRILWVFGWRVNYSPAPLQFAVNTSSIPDPTQGAAQGRYYGEKP